jgi:hypothetical protein
VWETIFVATVIIILPAPTTKIVGEFDVCVLKEKTKIFTGFDDVCENLSYE